jgi:hypothetical protein
MTAQKETGPEPQGSGSAFAEVPRNQLPDELVGGVRPDLVGSPMATLTAPAAPLLSVVPEPSPEAPKAEEKPVADVEVIIPVPGELVIDGIAVNVNRLKTREFMGLLRILTRGSSPILGQFEFSDNPRDLTVQLMTLLTFALPEQPDDFIGFIQTIVSPKKPEDQGAVLAALLNPELGVMVDVMTVLAAQEAEDDDPAGPAPKVDRWTTRPFAATFDLILTEYPGYTDESLLDLPLCRIRQMREVIMERKAEERDRTLDLLETQLRQVCWFMAASRPWKEGLDVANNIRVRPRSPEEVAAEEKAAALAALPPSAKMSQFGAALANGGKA